MCDAVFGNACLTVAIRVSVIIVIIIVIIIIGIVIVIRMCVRVRGWCMFIIHFIRTNILIIIISIVFVTVADV